MTIEPAELSLPDPESIRASIAKDSLVDFVREAWPLVEPETELLWNWHLDEICDALTAITRGDLRRVIFNVPPGTAKSLVASVFWPAWEWATYPGLRYLTAAYSDVNTIRDNRRLRSIVQSDWFKRHYKARLSSEQWAKIRFDTVQKGWRIATSVGGMGTGEHPDRIIIDDPHKAEEAMNDVARNHVGNWFKSTISTRKARDPAIIIIMQRLHQDDLSGRLLSTGTWEHICLPMRFDPEGKWECPCHPAPDRRDHRTQPGELLWPDLWPEEKVQEEEVDLGVYGTSGQLDQRPTPVGGGMFKREWFEIVDAVPVDAVRRCRGWDTAGTEGAGDWTSGVKLAECADGTYIVEHRVHAQTEDADVLIKQTAKADGVECMVREEKEGGASGLAVIRARTKALVGHDYEGVTISGSKPVRARPFKAQAKAGNVKILRGTWNEGYLDVMCSFPFGPEDDDVDATTCAFNALVADPIRPDDTVVW